MKTLYQIIKENPENFNQEEVKEYVEEFIQKYENSNRLERAMQRSNLDEEFITPFKQDFPRYGKIREKKYNESQKALAKGLVSALRVAYSCLKEKYMTQIEENTKKELKKVYKDVRKEKREFTKKLVKCYNEIHDTDKLEINPREPLDEILRISKTPNGEEEKEEVYFCEEILRKDTKLRQAYFFLKDQDAIAAILRYIGDKNNLLFGLGCEIND